MVSMGYPELEVRILCSSCSRRAEQCRSAIVGLGVMIVLLPVPRKIAKLMSSVQKEKMMVVSLYFEASPSMD